MTRPDLDAASVLREVHAQGAYLLHARPNLLVIRHVNPARRGCEPIPPALYRRVHKHARALVDLLAWMVL
jgi:hypothetical protein